MDDPGCTEEQFPDEVDAIVLRILNDHVPFAPIFPPLFIVAIPTVNLRVIVIFSKKCFRKFLIVISTQHARENKSGDNKIKGVSFLINRQKEDSTLCTHLYAFMVVELI